MANEFFLVLVFNSIYGFCSSALEVVTSNYVGRRPFFSVKAYFINSGALRWIRRAPKITRFLFQPRDFSESARYRGRAMVGALIMQSRFGLGGDSAAR